MALILGGPPTRAQAKAMHTRVGKSLARFVLRTERHKHARDHKVRALAPNHNAVLTSFAWTHTITKAIGDSWKYGMTAAQRTYWAGLAAVNFVQVEDGSHRELTGPQLWSWWASKIFPQYDPLTRYINAADIAPFYNGPSVWNPPSAPSGIFIQGDFGGSLSLGIYSTPFLNPYVAYVTKRGIVTTGTLKMTPGGLRLASAISQDDPPSGLLDLVVYPTGRTFSTTELYGYLIRIRVCSDSPNFVPSDFHDIGFPIP